jgi:alkanesulfonate monooxygenase SsuD/methylene tetrahydromethanopterin reductase-like flavin-dependent oxidoreductase (luciferase family)
VWIGGTAPAVLELAARTGAWNRWGGDAATVGREAAAVRATGPATRITWGGLVVLAPNDADAQAKAARIGARPGTLVGSPATVAGALEPYLEIGLDWVVLGPVDSSDVANASLIGALRGRLGR